MSTSRIIFFSLLLTLFSFEVRTAKLLSYQSEYEISLAESEQVRLPNKTYVPLEWDFSNLEEIFETFIKNYKLRNEIISNSQQVYMESVNENGMNKFCNWFIKSIE